MNKQSKNILILVSILLILIIILSGLFVYFSNKNITGKVILEDNIDNLNETDIFSSVNELHYGNMPITYTLKEEECGAVMTERIKKAFDIISNETDNVVIFEDVSNKSVNESQEVDIVIHCYRELKEDKEFYISGEAIYSSEGANPNLIALSDINFYKVNPEANNQFSGGCTGYPNTEIHEILHTFGFEHKEGYSIMNPISDGCRITMIEKEITDKLKEIYK